MVKVGSLPSWRTTLCEKSVIACWVLSRIWMQYFSCEFPWMYHAVVTTCLLARSHFLTDHVLFTYVASQNRTAFKVSIQLIGRQVCLCLPWPTFVNRQERCQWRWFLTVERIAHNTQEEVYCNTGVTWERLKRASLTSCEEWWRLE